MDKEIKFGQVWAYNRDDSEFSPKGEEYVIVQPVVVKVGHGAHSWQSGVSYARENCVDSRVFVRDEETFRQRFNYVRG